ncbi:MAG: tetratricopeptide repeat protein [Actinobacteria bacterium]|nr:tetratricopeptide repeat protein [Actinomycetota bacterium]
MSGLRSDSSDRYGRLCQRLLESFGLQFAPHSKDIDIAVRIRLESLGLSWPAYRDLLDTPEGGEELLSLAGELSIRQMCFNDEHLLAVSRRFLKPLLRNRLASTPQGSKPSLSIWSVGCGCGEEIYSLLLQLANCTNLSAWDLHILATDISHRSLEQAKTGIYLHGQLNRIDRQDLQRHFIARTRLAEEPITWAIVDDLKSLVDFRLHNMLALEVPADCDSQFNLILCRSMLKQLSPQAKTQVLSKLARALSPGGLLIVSATESAGLDHPLLQPASEEFNSVLRRRTVRAKQMPAEMSELQVGPTLPALRSKLRRIYLPASVKSAPSRRKPPDPAVDDRAMAAEFLQRAQQLADDFQFPQALLVCRRARQLDEFNAEAHYLTGVMARRMDRLDEALEALQRACRLDRTLVMAHFLLGHIYQEIDKPALAKHHYNEALAALADTLPDEPVPFADGMSPQVLRDLCTAGQDALIGANVGET